MRTSRWILAMTALLAVTSLSACSGSDSDPGADAQPSGTPSASASDDAPFERVCTVQVRAIGTAEASWDGRGKASNSAGMTIYQFVKGDDKMTVFAGSDDIATNANITIDGATYTTTDPDSGLDVADDGTKAEVDADTSGVDGDGPHVTATFTCGKGRG